MRCVKELAYIVIGLGLSVSTNAETTDTVEVVKVCNADVGIKLANSGWVVVLETEVGSVNVERVQTLANYLLASGSPAGNISSNTVMTWCGISNVKPIKALSAASSQI